MTACRSFGVRAQRRSQRGAFALVAIVMITAMVALALAASLNLGGSLAGDAQLVNRGVEALYVAESGVERAARRFVAEKVACTSLSESAITTSTGKTFTITQLGNTDFSNNTNSGCASCCRVQVVGSVDSGASVRTVEAILGNGNAGTRASGTCVVLNVDPGEKLGLVVAVTWRSNYGETVTSVKLHTYTAESNCLGGTLITSTTPLVGPVSNPDLATSDKNLPRFSTQIHLLRDTTNLVAGTYKLEVLFTNPGVNGYSQQVAIGAITLAGVDQSTPLPATQPTPLIGNSTSPSVTIPAQTNAGYFVVDAVATSQSGTTLCPTGTDCTSTSTGDRLYYMQCDGSTAGGNGKTCNNNTNKNNAKSEYGTGTYKGEITTTTSFSMTWTRSSSDLWAMAAVVVPADTSQAAASRHVRLAGKGLQKWRELIATP